MVNSYPRTSKWITKIVKGATGVAVSLVFFLLLIEKAPINEIIPEVYHVKLKVLVIGVVTLLFGYGVRAYRWQVMLRSFDKNIGLLHCLNIYMSGVATNNTLPLRIGDIIRAGTLSATSKISFTTALFSIVFERVLDFAILALAGSLFLLCVVNSEAFLIQFDQVISQNLVLVAVISLLVSLLLLKTIAKPVWQFFVKACERFHPSLMTWLKNKKIEVNDASSQMLTFGKLVQLIFLSFVGWAGEFGAFYWCAISLDLNNALLGSTFSMLAATLSTLLPSAPGFMGTFHFFAAMGAEQANNPQVVAVAYAIITHSMIWSVGTFFGLSSIVILILKKAYQKDKAN